MFWVLMLPIAIIGTIYNFVKARRAHIVGDDGKRFDANWRIWFGIFLVAVDLVRIMTLH